MNFSIEHIAIPATNPVALKDWYVRVLGRATVFNNGQTPPVCLIALGGAWLEIYAAETPLAERGNNKLAGFRHVALRVDSLGRGESGTGKARREIHGRNPAGGGRGKGFILRGWRGQSAAPGRAAEGFCSGGRDRRKEASRTAARLFFLRADDENRDGGLVAHLGDGAAVKNIAEQPVAVAGHGDQIAMFAFGDLEDFRRRIAERQHGFNGKSVAAKLAGDFFQILAVVFHFLGLGQLELVEIARDPAVGDVQQQQLRPGQADQRLDVVENDLVGRRCFRAG